MKDDKRKLKILVDNGFDEDYHKFLKKFGEITLLKIDDFIKLINEKEEEVRKHYSQKYGENEISGYIIEANLSQHVESLNIDLILFTGGADVNPALYSQRVNPQTSFDDKRDDDEGLVFKLCSAIPKLGICRGAQYLCVLHGGSLIQHVEGHQSSHMMHYKLSPDDNRYLTLETTSSHHQMMYPFSIKNSRRVSYELLAWSKRFQSNVYLNGDSKPIELDRDFLEPEIVLFKKQNVPSLAIQGHPEWNFSKNETDSHIVQLINSVLLNNNKNGKTNQ